jgi:hydroxymethylpyrimidine pyrophosphatase-like HAD family hydrolase
MGQYLAVGLRLKASVRKEKQLDGKSVGEILGKVEDKYNLSEIYERREEETYYEYSIKKEVLDKELVPLIEKFYALRYTKDERTDAADVIEALKALPDTSARLELLNERRFQTYQDGDDMDYCGYHRG